MDKVKTPQQRERLSLLRKLKEITKCSPPAQCQTTIIVVIVIPTTTITVTVITTATATTTVTAAAMIVMTERWMMAKSVHTSWTVCEPCWITAHSSCAR